MDRSTDVSYHVERVRENKSYLEADLMLLYVIRGGIQITLEDRREKISQGGIYLVNPCIAYEMKSDEDALVGICAWSIPVLSRIMKGRHVYLYCNSAAGYSRWHSELKETLENMTLVYAAMEHQTDCLMIGYLYRVLDFLIEHFQVNGGSDEGGRTDFDRDANMSQIMHYILNN